LGRLVLQLLVVAAVACADDPCPFPPFYAPEEQPMVHQIELVMPKIDFRNMVDNQGDRNYPETPTTIIFDGVRLPGGKLQVHGGSPQRGSPTPGAGDAGSCRIGNRDEADGLPSCKPSIRLNFGKHNRPSGEPRIWGFPAALQGCAAPDKMVLRNEWNDGVMMIRNKLSQDLYNKAGAQVVRIEFARLTVNGTYFGFYTLEERMDDDFLRCRGWANDEAAGTALYKSYPDRLGYGGFGDWSCDGKWDSPELCTLGFERKIPDCDGCSNDAFTDPSMVFPKPGLEARLGEQPAACYVQETTALNQSCPAPTDLYELFHAVSEAATLRGAGESNVAQAKVDLAARLNITTFLVWNVLTNFIDECDHGGHNYYLYRPASGEPWSVINYDMDWGWGCVSSDP
jgi:hypothetical protein